MFVQGMGGFPDKRLTPLTHLLPHYFLIIVAGIKTLNWLMV